MSHRRVAAPFYTPADGPRGIIAGGALRRLTRAQRQPAADAATLQELHNHAFAGHRAPRAPRLVAAPRPAETLRVIPLEDFLATPPVVEERILHAPPVKRPFDFQREILCALAALRLPVSR